MRCARGRCVGSVVVLGLVAVACADGPATPPSTPSPSPSAAAGPAPSSSASPPSPPSPSPSASSSPSSSSSTTTTVEVFLSNADRGDPCEEVVGVERDVPADDALRGALAALLAGPTPQEAAAGYGGWFGEATAGLLLDVRVEGRIALVDLDPRLPAVIPNAATSCGSTALLASLDATATQFSAVDRARYALDGDRVAFYHWLQRPAPGDEPPRDLPAEPSGPPDDPDPPAPEPPAPDPRAVPDGLVGTEWTTLPTSERVVALTFDGGANADGAASVLRTLAETGTPATFFLTGRFTVAYPAISASIGARHPVGNHTMHHTDLTELTDVEVRREVLAAHDEIVAAAGRNPRPWFRFPYGARDKHVIDVVNGLGYGAVRWTTDTLGWQGTSGGRTVDTVVARVLGDLRPGQVVLLHLGSHPEDGSTLDADALPSIVRRVREAGYAFVALDAVLE